MTSKITFLSLSLLLLTILTIFTIQSHYTYGKYTEGSLLSGQKIPFTISLPIRIGLVGFNENSYPPVKVDTSAMVRSLTRTLNSYIPRDLDHGKYLNIQFQYIYDVFHVSSTTQNEVESLLAMSLHAAKDGFNRHVITHNPRKINAQNQFLPLSKEESDFYEHRVKTDSNSQQASPLYEVNIGEIDSQLQDILNKALSTYLKFTQNELTPSKDQNTLDDKKNAFQQTKRGPDKEYSIFILNPRRYQVMDQSPIKPAVNSTTGPLPPVHDYLYGYTGRSMTDVVKTRQTGLGGHFGSYSYTNTWVTAGRMIIADVQAISSVGTTLDRQDAFLEEILSNIYKTMSTGSTLNTIQQQNPFGMGGTQQNVNNHGEAFSNGENSQGVSTINSGIDIYRVGLLSKRYQQQITQTDEITLFFTGKQEGRVVSTGRANTLLPSLYDTSSLTTIIANPSSISTLQQVGLVRTPMGTKRPAKADGALLQALGRQITPLLSSYISAAIKQLITTDITIPHQQLPIPSIHYSDEAQNKTPTISLLPSVLTIPILVFTDHSFPIKVEDLIDMTIVEKVVSKLSITTTVKVVPIIHNIHTFPALSTTLFGSIGTVSIPGMSSNMMFSGPSYYNVLNGDAVSHAIFKAALTSPILASIIPNQNQQRSDIIGSLMKVLGDSFTDEKDSWFDLSISGSFASSSSSARNYFKQKDNTDSTSNTKNQPTYSTSTPKSQNQVIPVILFSLVALPQDSTIIYPDTTTSSTNSNTNQAGGSHQKPLVLHIHNIHKQQQNLPNIPVLGQLRKELTLKVMSSLISKLTGSIPPYLKYDFSEKVPLPGLVTSDHLALASTSSISLYTQVQPSQVFTSMVSDTVTSITNSQRQLALGFTTQHKTRTNGDKLFLSYDEQNDSAIGRSLHEFIDSTWTIGMHTYGPYATMYKSTKIYRDASRRNIVSVAISELLSQLWSTVSSSCEFINSYGFLANAKWQEGFILDPMGNPIENSQAAINHTLSSLKSSPNSSSMYENLETDASNDIMRFMTHNDWVNIKKLNNMSCFLPFKPVPHFRDQTHDELTKKLLSELDQIDPRKSHQISSAMHMYSMKKNSVEEWLQSNGVQYDQRMVEYLSVHSNAPIYVLTQMIRIADVIGAVEQKLFKLQEVLDSSLQMSSLAASHDTYADYWHTVFVQLYHFAHRVSMLGDVTNDVKQSIKSTYSSCRVVQKQQGNGEYTGYGFGANDDGIPNEFQRSQTVHRVRFDQDAIQAGNDDDTASQGFGNTLLRALGVGTTKGAKITTALAAKSPTKTLKSQLFGFIVLCFIVAALLFFMLLVFVVVCADCQGVSPRKLFGLDTSSKPVPKSIIQLENSFGDNNFGLNTRPLAQPTSNYGHHHRQSGNMFTPTTEDEFEDEQPLKNSQMYGQSSELSSKLRLTHGFQPTITGFDTSTPSQNSRTSSLTGLSQSYDGSRGSHGSRNYSHSREYDTSSGFSHEPIEDAAFQKGFNNTVSTLQSYLTDDDVSSDCGMDNNIHSNVNTGIFPPIHSQEQFSSQLPPPSFQQSLFQPHQSHQTNFAPPPTQQSHPQQYQQSQQPITFSQSPFSPPIQPKTISPPSIIQPFNPLSINHSAVGNKNPAGSPPTAFIDSLANSANAIPSTAPFMMSPMNLQQSQQSQQQQQQQQQPHQSHHHQQQQQQHHPPSTSTSIISPLNSTNPATSTTSTASTTSFPSLSPPQQISQQPQLYQQLQQSSNVPQNIPRFSATLPTFLPPVQIQPPTTTTILPPIITTTTTTMTSPTTSISSVSKPPQAFVPFSPPASLHANNTTQSAQLTTALPTTIKNLPMVLPSFSPPAFFTQQPLQVTNSSQISPPAPIQSQFNLSPPTAQQQQAQSQSRTSPPQFSFSAQFPTPLPFSPQPQQQQQQEPNQQLAKPQLPPPGGNTHSFPVPIPTFKPFSPPRP